MTIEVNLQDLLLASRQLSEMAEQYGTVIEQAKSAYNVSSGKGNEFETGEVASAWQSAVGELWTIFADTQDNLNETSIALVRYINAVCEQDGANAKDLEKEVKEYNKALFDNYDTDNDGYIESKDKKDGDEEMRKAGYSKDEFNKLDANDDGKLSREEQKEDERHEPLPEPDRENEEEVIDEPDPGKAERPKGD